MDVGSLSLKALLELQSSVMFERKGRGVTRSSNNPVGDLARFLFADAFGWTLESDAGRGVDAVSAKGSKIRIRGRRLLDDGEARLSDLGDPSNWAFAWLAAAVFDRDYNVVRAAVIPASNLAPHLVGGGRSGDQSLVFNSDVLALPGVFDASERLAAALGQAEIPRAATIRRRRRRRQRAERHQVLAE